jgi:hypothetical protein
MFTVYVNYIRAYVVNVPAVLNLSYVNARDQYLHQSIVIINVNIRIADSKSMVVQHCNGIKQTANNLY